MRENSALRAAVALAVILAGAQPPAAVSPARAASISQPLKLTVISHDGTVMTPPQGLTAGEGAAAAGATAAGGIYTTEGGWSFGTPPEASGDYPLLLNGASSGLAAVLAEITNGNLYARTKASGHYWCRFDGRPGAPIWVDVGAAAPAEGTIATEVTLTPADPKIPVGAPAGTLVATAAVAMQPSGAPFSGALVSSNPLYKTEGTNVVLARAPTEADLGPQPATITALVQ